MPSICLRRRIAGSLALLFAATLIPTPGVAGLLDQVKQRGTLQVGMEGTYPPFNFEDEKGHLVGFEVDFIEALAKKLGVKPDIQLTKWDGMLAALDSQRLDIVANQVTVTPDREKKYDFSTPYTVSGIQIITRKADADKLSKPEELAGKRVGVVLGSNYEQWLRANAPKADVRTYDDDATRNQDLRVGRIDAMLNDRLVAAYLIKASDGAIAASGPPFAKQIQAIPVRKGNPDLLQAIDKAIADLQADGTMKQISMKWFGVDVTK